MSVMGVGHKVAIPVVIYLAIAFLFSLAFSPVFRITSNSYDKLFQIGIIVAVIGFSLNLAAAFQMLRAHKRNKLASNGLYRLFLNPMYTFQLLITLPGLLLLFNSWLILTTNIFTLIILKIFVKEEENYLEIKFGDEYREYKRKVLFKFL